MSSEKKSIRQQFRNAVFERDGNRCRGCGWSLFRDGITLDAHHITDRSLMPNGGYVIENGISLCSSCHEKAESYHRTGVAPKGWMPDDLYNVIGSSYDQAFKASRDQE